MSFAYCSDVIDFCCRDGIWYAGVVGGTVPESVDEMWSPPTYTVNEYIQRYPQYYDTWSFFVIPRVPGLIFTENGVARSTPPSVETKQ